MRDAFMMMIAESPDIGPRHVFADWLEEQGECNEAAAWRAEVVPTPPWAMYSLVEFFGSGSGSGSGRGIGIGIGSGSGSGRGSGSGSGSGIGSGSGRGRGSGRGIGSGSGSGIGRGIGIGIGSGSGSGSGSGIGRGSGRGIGIGKLTFGCKMIVGKNYLFHCGDWHTFVGRFVRFSGGLVCELEQVSKIESTNNGDNWHELVKGNKEARADASYIHYDTPTFVPLSIAAFEWVGELPKRK